MKRSGILPTAERVVHEEREHYAEPLEDFTRAANLMNDLGFRFSFVDQGDNTCHRLLRAEDIPPLMICVKLSRLMHETKVDGLVDIAGYIETWAIVLGIHPEEA